MNLLILAAIFIASLLIIEGLILIFRPRLTERKKLVEKRFARLSARTYGEEAVDITKKKRVLSTVPWLNSLLHLVPGIHQLDNMVIQSRTVLPLGVFLLLSLVLGIFLYFFMWMGTGNVIVSVCIGLIAAAVPIFYLKIKKHRRMQKFERQLPDALDLMARSLKAGHAFSGGLQLVAQEFDDPVGTEFALTLNEINYGLSVEQSLKNLSDRVDVPDLKFFTVSVIIQRESGGNLAEILENISALIRERFKLLGKIRSLSAEGRISAFILVALPFVIAFVLLLLNPKYVAILKNDPIGNVLVIVALIMMTLGILVMKKMINIRV